MDVWQLIAHDHAYLAHLIKERRFSFDIALTRDHKKVLTGLIDELTAHTEAVEASLYAPLRQMNRTRQLAEDLHHEHQQFIRQLDTFASLKQSGIARRSGLTLDVALIGQHLRRYTQELIPAARELLSLSQVDGAAHAFILAKTRTLRARQHHRSDTLALSNVVITGLICAIAASLSYFAGRSSPAKTAKVLEPRSRPEQDIPLLPSRTSSSHLRSRQDEARPGAHLMSIG